MRGTPDDRDLLPRRAPSLAQQLAGTLFDVPTRPDAAGDEQRRLDDERFHRWLETADGQRAWAWIVDRALTWAERRPKRIGVKSLFERCRDALHVHLDNRWTAAAARKLVDEHPRLRGLIRLKERS